MRSMRWTAPVAAMLTVAACEGGPTESAGSCIASVLLAGIDSIGHSLVYNTDLYPSQSADEVFTSMRRLPLSGTPRSVATRLDGRFAAVPLGASGAVALVNLETGTVEREFRFENGSADAAAWVSDDVVLVASRSSSRVGRFRVSQPGNNVIRETVSVPAGPLQVLVHDGQALVLSHNSPVFGQGGRVTALDPATLRQEWSVPTWGINPVSMQVGEGLLWVLNANGSPSMSRLMGMGLDSHQPERTYSFDTGARALNLGDLRGYVTVPGKGTGIQYLLDLYDTGPKPFLCASGDCSRVGTALSSPVDNLGILQTFVDRPWIYRFAYQPSEANVATAGYVLKDSIALPAGVQGLASLERHPAYRPCNDVISVD